MTVAQAEAAVVKAEENVLKAQRSRDAAYDQLDAVLAGRGWRRVRGALAADARLYEQTGGNVVPLADVLAAEREKSAA